MDRTSDRRPWDVISTPFKLRLLSLLQPMLVLPHSWWHQTVIPCEISRWGATLKQRCGFPPHSKEKRTVEVYLELCAWLEEAFEEMDLNGKVPSVERTSWRLSCKNPNMKCCCYPKPPNLASWSAKLFQICLKGQKAHCLCRSLWN